MNKKSLSVVLIPGFMLDEYLWDELVNALPREWKIFRATLKEGCTIKEIAQKIAENVPENFVLIGFSLGGYIARSIAEQFPERVKALILIASSLRPDSEEQKSQKLTAIRLNSKETFRGLSSISIAKTLHPSNAQNRDLVKRIQGMGNRLGYDEFVKQSMLDRSSYDMGKIICPTLIISGSEDQLRSDEEAIELLDQLPYAKHEVINNTGHMIPIEQADILALKISNWLVEKELWQGEGNFEN
ncbi:alpha/beta hydrolase [Acinetobacter sp. V91_7]|uniref:alpha/beta fold hydrolase n=1 Tax=unclassified Acinetobacter TaxID=196816 RepID=UPI00287D2090|nr:MULTISPECIES: alpha/beta hydrolase [unclassified Acinetobacter]MDS7933273.1 alpha/beta hydrolase [Acinetobacter sp. V91_4B]MDS7963498.1 alpha/beta hydrolase [Acinetobacter sp. V91_7]MDS8027527.1 alpha/beta hydrolase [Acinetobacter sp. V91_13]